MAITLGSIVLPSGLYWSDEHAWSPVEQATDRTLTGALVLEESIKTKGRPITLSGAKDGNQYTAWVALDESFLGFSSLTALRSTLLAAGVELTLTLHDGRTFNVAPRHDGDGPISVTPLAALGNLPPANPPASWRYAVDAIRLMEV